MKTLLVSAVLCLIVCALGEWATLVVLAVPVGSPSECHRGTYWDPLTRGCEPCSQLCDAVRDSQEDCREKCSDWLESRAEAKQNIVVWAVGGVGWLIAIILIVSLAIGHCKLCKKKKDQKPNKEQHGEPRTRCHPKDLTADLHQMHVTGQQSGPPSSPVQGPSNEGVLGSTETVDDDTPLSPSNMRSIHADATNTDDTTKPLLLVDAGNKTDAFTDNAQCEMLAS